MAHKNQKNKNAVDLCRSRMTDIFRIKILISHPADDNEQK